MCASAVREGLKNPEPESVLQQMCLGGREFLDELMAKSGQRPVRQRAGFEEIRTAIERVREERWDTLVSRHGDWSRELALYWIRENGHSIAGAMVTVLQPARNNRQTNQASHFEPQ